MQQQYLSIRIKQKITKYLYFQFIDITQYQQEQPNQTMQPLLKITTKQMGINCACIQNLCIKDISIGDFPAKPKQGWFLAHIYWGINYKFIARTVPNKQNYPMVVAQPSISPKSWMNPQCADLHLLQHQYGHYLIACWCALDFQETANYQYSALFKGTTVEKYKNWCAELFKSMMRKYCALQRKYDQQTQHYLEREKQAQWQAKIVSNINQFDKKSKQRRKILTKVENVRNQSKELKKIQTNKRAMSHNSKKGKITATYVIPGIQNTTGYRIRQTNLLKPAKII